MSGHRLIAGFIWGVGVLLITLFLGRVFCGFICPFGTIHHAIGAVRPAIKGNRMVQANQKTPAQRVKYFFLVLLLIGAIIGLNLSGLLDPIALFFRSLALSIIPGMGVGLRSIFDTMSNSDFKLLNQISYSADVLLSPVFGYNVQAYQTAWFIGLVFLYRCWEDSTEEWIKWRTPGSSGCRALCRKRIFWNSASAVGCV